MLLAVDIGNTNINCALIDTDGRIASRPRSFGVRSGQGVDRIIIVSVVPRALKRTERALRKRYNDAKIYVVGKNVKVPLKCAYDKKQIGQDRLVTAFAAKLLYGLPILVIDFGTAVTFDIVSARGVYAGGLILPGIKMSLESLSERTALLPKTYLKKTRSFIGRDTASSIRNGMIYGYASICEGLISRFRKKVAGKMKIVATGGDAPLIAKYTSCIERIDPDLSLKGLYFLSKILSENT